MMKTPYLCLLIGLSVMAFAQAPHQPQTRQQRQQEYLRLGRQLFPGYGHENDVLTDAAQTLRLRTQMDRLVAQSIKDILLTGTNKGEDVSSEIKALQGTLAPDSHFSNTPFSEMFTLGGHRNAAIAYVMPEGGLAQPDTHPRLHFYAAEGGEWRKTAEAPVETDFEGRKFFISRVESGSSNEALFLVSGFLIGNPGTPLTLRLYGYDGVIVRTVWERDGLTAGKVSVDKNIISVDFDREYKSSDPFNRVSEKFRVDMGGVHCITPGCP